ncbi:hypothetical protein [Salinarchaeum chitinilyticum]
MGNRVGSPPVSNPTEDIEDGQRKLGDLLAGRLSDVDVDSVEAVRELRERR